MELIIKEFVPQEVVVENFESLKAEITAKAGLYKNMVYTEETIKEAKSDKAALNKFMTALEDKRKEVKKECQKPYEAFEKQMKELVGIINEPVQLIDSQIKTYEDKVKAEKKEKIKTYWESTDHPEWLMCNQIFDQRWLNATYSLKKVQEAIDERLAEIKTHITTIGMIPDFSFEALETYKQTMDINRAISEGKRLAGIQKRKAEAEAEKKAAEEERARRMAEEKAAQQRDTDVEPIENVKPPAKGWVKFAACMTVAEAQELAKFFDDRGIEFKAI